jgi:glycosyltransferase involved in cell wall biosynthesis
MNNKFRIVIASYNNSDWVEYNIASVLNQTYTNYEVIYIDDASTDDTRQRVKEIIGNDPRFTIIEHDVNMGGTYNHMYYSTLDLEDDNIIICLLDGDDWLYDETVLSKLNDFYNKNQVWMTYGGMYVYRGGDSVELPSPQNSVYSDYVHQHKLYRNDHWRASHFRTYRSYLFKNVSLDTMRSLKTNEFYWQAGDLALQYPCLEMCSKERIGVLDFPTYVYNAIPQNHERTLSREQSTDHRSVEIEIRNRKHYKEGLGGEKLPQINVIGYEPLRTKMDEVSFTHNLYEGEFDYSLITDFDIPRYVRGEFTLNSGKVIADLYESPDYSADVNALYDLVYENHAMFDRILTYDERLLGLPNARLRFNMAKTFLSKDFSTTDEHIQIYQKHKNISCVSSNKSFLEGHRVRLSMVNHILSNDCKDYFDMYGIGFQQIETKMDALKEYRFSIAIENGYRTNYATEKLSDCFLTGTIPIYFGCPNVRDYFDKNGIITFTTKEELQDIITGLHENGEMEYEKRMDAVRNNFETVKRYALSPSEHFQVYLKDLL